MIALVLTPLMQPAPLSVLIVLLGVVLAVLLFWAMSKPTQPEAIVVADLRTVLARIEAGGGQPADEDRAELQRLLDYAHRLNVKAGVVRAGDALLQGS